ncbi:MAG: hypothetical protein Q8P40_02460, partial [Nitrospirota bacterium]|nr:hypothetical protein [Nitrospirota bacterium]
DRIHGGKGRHRPIPELALTFSKEAARNMRRHISCENSVIYLQVDRYRLIQAVVGKPADFTFTPLSQTF